MTQLKVGDVAPQFTGVNQDGNPVSLSDFRGKKVILYFYPKDTRRVARLKRVACVMVEMSCNGWGSRLLGSVQTVRNLI